MIAQPPTRLSLLSVAPGPGAVPRRRADGQPRPAPHREHRGRAMGCGEQHRCTELDETNHTASAPLSNLSTASTQFAAHMLMQSISTAVYSSHMMQPPAFGHFPPSSGMSVWPGVCSDALPRHLRGLQGAAPGACSHPEGASPHVSSGVSSWRLRTGGGRE